jgi:outer membrane protein OmpA-like peptidoglycan-associated protein
MPIKNILLTSFATVVFTVAASAAFATNHAHDHARDERGNFVRDARGNCVLTKWNAQSGECRDGLDQEARTVYFEFNRHNLTPEARKKLDVLALSVKESDRVDSLDIVGSADRIGQNTFNQKLSERRAAAVRDYLKKKGMRIGKVIMEAVGEERPVSECDEAKMSRKELIACLWRDRRVEVRLNNIHTKQ